MNPFQKFVAAAARNFLTGKNLAPVGLKKIIPSRTTANAPGALLFSPHPDDECITGGLPLRLQDEAKWNVINVAVTLGSQRERQVARRRELQRACATLGFRLIVPGRPGLEPINLGARKRQPARWRAASKTLAEILAARRPRVIFLPHAADAHPTHIATHHLVLGALKMLPPHFHCFIVETEFWGQMAAPNLLVELQVDDVARLVAALTCHAGEVRRNPYHARLPAWLMDNVRRGAEIVGDRGGTAPDFTFGTIYRLSRWQGKKMRLPAGRILSATEDPAALFAD